MSKVDPHNILICGTSRVTLMIIHELPTNGMSQVHRKAKIMYNAYIFVYIIINYML